VPALVEAGATAVELMVAPALMGRRAEHRGGATGLAELPPTSAALLVEFGRRVGRRARQARCRRRGDPPEHETIRPPDFTRDPERIEVSSDRAGGAARLIGRFRAPGTSLIIEDVCVPPERIDESARDIQAPAHRARLLAGVAGHASAGNLHFMLTRDFSKQEDTDRYEAFMEKLVELILDKYDGSLKAEHGTGVNMAPYVEREWGEKATELMWRVKELADPEGVLAPGVLLSRDEGAHLRTPEDDARDRGGRDELRRVWFLRARLPEPASDDHPAAANRHPPGDGPPAEGIARAAGADRAVRVRRDPDLRRRRAPARSPAHWVLTRAR